MLRFVVLATLAFGLVVGLTAAAPSIESEPVKVTHRNSGPRYEISDDVEKIKLSQVGENLVNTNNQSPRPAAPVQQQPPASEKEEPRPSADGSPSAEEMPTPIGHLSIRRIFLVPMMMPNSRPDWHHSAGEEERQPAAGAEREASEERPPMTGGPFWPFLAPPARVHQSHSQPQQHRHHLIGSDEASRGPMRESLGERESEPATSGSQPEPRERPLLDPIQMMIDMMHQALSGQLLPVPAPADLDKQASGSRGDGGEANAKEAANKETGLASPLGARNETREDIVEIEGKKYIRKTIINRHVGENLIFMTRRLQFIPLNETDSSEGAAEASSTTAPSPTEAGADKNKASIATEVPQMPSSSVAPKDEESTTTTTTTTSTTEAPSTEAAQTEPSTATTAETSEQPTATNAPSDSEASTPGSLTDRLSDLINKAERYIEKSEASSTTTTTTTEKPTDMS